MTEKQSFQRAIKILKAAKPKISAKDKALCLLEERLRALESYGVYKWGNKTPMFSTGDLREAVSVATVFSQEENKRTVIKRKARLVWDSKENMTLDIFSEFS